MNFRSFLENNPLKIQNSFSQNTVGTHNDYATAAFLPSTFTGSDDLGPMGYGLPDTDLRLPVVTRDSTILKVLNAPAQDRPFRMNDKSNRDPITIMLVDKTTIVIPYSRYASLASKRSFSPGDRVKVCFRRLPSDKSPNNSQIISIE